MALVAERKDPETGEREILGVGRLSRDNVVSNEAEVALLISDHFQRQGLGTTLLEKLLEVGRAESLSRITANVLFENRVMQRILRTLGFKLRRDVEQMVMKADLDLYQMA